MIYPAILRTCFLALGALLASAGLSTAHAQDAVSAPPGDLVRLQRCPSDGLHPRTVVQGTRVHLLYFLGAPEGGDLFYAFSDDDGLSFSDPLPVNDDDANVDVRGGTRAPSLAVTSEGGVHVAWLGSEQTGPRGPAGEGAVLYTRLDPMQGTFEPARNLVRAAYGLNTAPALAAHGEHVFVFWHAPAPRGESDEEASAGQTAGELRRVWLARSSDSGLSFAAEVAIDPEQGVSERSGMDAATRPDGTLHLAYRTRVKKVRRHSHLLTSVDGGETFSSTFIANWKRQNCPATTVELTSRGKQIYAAWEQFGTVGWSPIDRQRHTATVAREPKADKSAWRSRPAVCAKGKYGVVAWMEGEKNKPPTKLGWQSTNLDNGQRVEIGWVEDMDARSTPTVFARVNGFTVLY